MCCWRCFCLRQDNVSDFFGSIVSLCRTWLVNISQLNGARTSNNGGAGNMRHPKNVTKSNVGDRPGDKDLTGASAYTKWQKAHKRVFRVSATQWSLFSPHWKRCSYLVQMAAFKKSPTVAPLALFFSFSKPQFRTPREIATNHSWPPLFGCSLIWGGGWRGGLRYILWRFTTDYRCVYFQSARRKADWIAWLACFGPKQSEIVASSDDFFCYLLFGGKNCVLYWDN